MDFNRILRGDVVERLVELPPDCVHCVVTSPPYWGLRDYSIPPRTWSDGSACVYGLEETPELFIDHTVEIFEHVRRVLRPDGVLFLNFGDKYADDTKYGGRSTGKHYGKHKRLGTSNHHHRKLRLQSNRKSGELCNIPYRIAEALSAAGWYLRATIIWHKPSPMPESVLGWQWVQHRIKVRGKWGPDNPHPSQRSDEAGRATMGRHSGAAALHAEWRDCPGCEKCTPNGGLILRRGKWRPTVAHEPIFMLSKSDRYFCDQYGVLERTVERTVERLAQNVESQAGSERANGHTRPDRPMKAVGDPEFRNPRSVWTITSGGGFKGKHFATFPIGLPMKCITAGTSGGGCCPACGAPYSPIMESTSVPTRPGRSGKVAFPTGWAVGDGEHTPAALAAAKAADAMVIGNRDPVRKIAVRRLAGYKPTCQCHAGEPVGCVVLDPFAGSGTTCRVANHLGRRWLGIEVNPQYADIADRMAQKPICKRKPTPKHKRPVAGQATLFDVEE